MSTDISLAELVHSNELWKSSGYIRIGQQLKSDRARGVIGLESRQQLRTGHNAKVSVVTGSRSGLYNGLNVAAKQGQKSA